MSVKGIMVPTEVKVVRCETCRNLGPLIVSEDAHHDEMEASRIEGFFPERYVPGSNIDDGAVSCMAINDDGVVCFSTDVTVVEGSHYAIV